MAVPFLEQCVAYDKVMGEVKEPNTLVISLTISEATMDFLKPINSPAYMTIPVTTRNENLTKRYVGSELPDQKTLYTESFPFNHGTWEWDWDGHSTPFSLVSWRKPQSSLLLVEHGEKGVTDFLEKKHKCIVMRIDEDYSDSA